MSGLELVYPHRGTSSQRIPMSYKVMICTEESLQDKLNGAVGFGPISNHGTEVDGLTVIFTAPAAATVTFYADHAMTPAEILAALIDGVDGLEGEIRTSAGGPTGAQSMIILWGEAGIGIDKDGTANSLLRISTAADQENTMMDPDQVIAINNGSQQGHYTLLYLTEVP
jgi:hypothetical protein